MNAAAAQSIRSHRPRLGMFQFLPLIDKQESPLLIAMVVVVALGLSLGFTNHPAGEAGLDWQNGTKLLVWSALLMWGVVRWRLLFPLLFVPAGAVLAFLSALAALSVFWSPVPLYTAGSAIGFVAYIVLGGLTACRLTIDTVLMALLWSLLGFIALGLLAAFYFPDVAWLPPSVEENVYRLQGLAGNPNSFGHHAALYVVVAMACATRGLVSLKPFCLHALLGLSVLLLSGDRTVVLALLLTMGLTALRHYVWARWIGFGIGCLVAMTLFFYATGMGPNLRETLQVFSRTGSANEILTLTGRTEIWSAAFDRILERPIFGWGFNGTEALMINSMAEGFTGQAVNAHNMYLQLALTLGIVGFLPGFSLAVMLGRAYFKNPLPYRDLIAGLIVFNGLAEADIFVTPVLTGFVFFWLLLREQLQGPHFRPIREI